MSKQKEIWTYLLLWVLLYKYQTILTRIKFVTIDKKKTVWYRMQDFNFTKIIAAWLSLDFDI